MDKTSQPKVFYYLSCTEIWERFSYYTMSYLIVLYASARISDQGLGWSKSDALHLVGYYTLGVYTMPLLGGWLGDKYLGLKNTTILGGFLMMCGHILMIFSNVIPLFYSALILLMLGNGFFKPSMISLVGNLYEKGDIRRDSGFSYYYMAVNIGSVSASIVGGLIAKNLGYHPAFLSAGVGMACALIIFMCGKKFLPKETHRDEITSEESHKQPSFMSPDQLKENTNQKQKIWILCICYFFAFAWTVSYQISQGGTLTLYVQQFTDRNSWGFEIPTPWFMSLNPIYILLLTPVLIAFWKWIDTRFNGFHIHSITKVAIGLAGCTIAFAILTQISYAVEGKSSGLINPLYIAAFVLFATIGELMVSPIMYSLTSQLAPKKHIALFQSFNFFLIGIAGVLASRIGGYALSGNPAKIFQIVMFCILVMTVLLFIIKNRLIRVAKS
ncbi:MAG: peptide MFS transporter [Bdellovibrionota bacterium]